MSRSCFLAPGESLLTCKRAGLVAIRVVSCYLQGQDVCGFVVGLFFQAGWFGGGGLGVGFLDSRFRGNDNGSVGLLGPVGRVGRVVLGRPRGAGGQDDVGRRGLVAHWPLESGLSVPPGARGGIGGVNTVGGVAEGLLLGPRQDR